MTYIYVNVPHYKSRSRPIYSGHQARAHHLITSWFGTQMVGSIAVCIDALALGLMHLIAEMARVLASRITCSKEGDNTERVLMCKRE